MKCSSLLQKFSSVSYCVVVLAISHVILSLLIECSMIEPSAISWEKLMFQG